MSVSANPSSSKPRHSGRGWPTGIAIGLGAVVVANAVMISIALRHPSVPASKDHWSESLAWDQELARREASAALGWSVAKIERSGEGAQHLEFSVVDRQGQPVLGLRGQMRLERSDSADHDANLELSELGSGRYRSEAGVPSTGLYRATLLLDGRHGEHFELTRQLALGDVAP